MCKQAVFIKDCVYAERKRKQNVRNRAYRIESLTQKLRSKIGCEHFHIVQYLV